jgi:HK97 family phage portal protein
MAKFSLKGIFFKPEKQGNSYFYPLSFIENLFDTSDYLKDFLEIPELNAILNIRARALSSWKLEALSKTTGKPQSNNESLVRILRNPNWFQSQGEFWRQASLFKDIYGNSYLYFLTPIGMPNTFKGLFTLDPSKVEIVYKSNTTFFKETTDENVEYYYHINKTEKILLEKDNLIHLNDNRVESKNILKGTSKLEALQAPLKNIRAAYAKRNIVLRTPVGILSNGQADDIGQAIPMDSEEKEKAQAQLKARGADPIITNLAIKYNAININAANLGLFDEVREDTTRICDVFGVPYELLANQKGTTFTNLKEAKKQFYEDTIIPEADEITDALNMMLKTDSKAWGIKGDYSHLAIFSEDQKNRADSLNVLVNALDRMLAAGAITIEQYKKEISKYGI